jgi:hypothetical protein
MRHIHEAKTHRRLVSRLALARLRPAHGFEQRQTERGSEASEASAAVEMVVGGHEENGGGEQNEVNGRVVANDILTFGFSIAAEACPADLMGGRSCLRDVSDRHKP